MTKVESRAVRFASTHDKPKPRAEASKTEPKTEKTKPKRKPSKKLGR